MAGERLRVTSGAKAGETIALDGELILGRAEKGAGSLGGDQELSRRHARLSRAPDGSLVIEDLGSTNGTVVNGSRISGPTALKPGDAIEVGDTKLETLPDPDATRIASRAQETTIAKPPPPPPPAEPATPPPPRPAEPAPPQPAPVRPRRAAPTEPVTPSAQPPFRPPGRDRASTIEGEAATAGRGSSPCWPWWGSSRPP